MTMKQDAGRLYRKLGFREEGHKREVSFSSPHYGTKGFDTVC